MKEEHAKAYLTNLEQINLAEETTAECWNEVRPAEFRNLFFTSVTPK